MLLLVINVPWLSVRSGPIGAGIRDDIPLLVDSELAQNSGNYGRLIYGNPSLFCMSAFLLVVLFPITYLLPYSSCMDP